VSQVDAPAEPAQDAVSERVTDTHLHRRWLLLTRIVWGVLVAMALGMFVVSIPGYIAQLQTLCTGASCSIGQLSADAITSLEHLGLSLGGYVAFNVALILIATLVGCALALLLVLRRSDDWMALLVAFMLVYLVSGSIANTVVLSHWVGSALASILFSILGELGFISAVLVFYLFPDGRLVPRWTRWVMLVVIGASLPFMIIPYTSAAWLTVVSTLIYSCALISLVIAQIYRYRRVSSLLQRQQTKWVVYSLTVTILLVVGLVLLPLLFVPALGQSGSLSDSILNTIVNLLFYVLLPISFGIAILRYHLYNIDVLINRTLVYGTLTVILTGVYVALVIGLQALLRGILSQDNSVAIVISTLAIAALFQPLRQRLQKIIDRSFYRRKYDAAKIIEAFSATLRQEVDLEQLREELVAVVEETMQPTQVFLWLPKPKQPRQYQAKAWVSNDLVPPHQE
jgi:hypothetical protein